MRMQQKTDERLGSIFVACGHDEVHLTPDPVDDIDETAEQGAGRPEHGHEHRVTRHALPKYLSILADGSLGAGLASGRRPLPQPQLEQGIEMVIESIWTRGRHALIRRSLHLPREAPDLLACVRAHARHQVLVVGARQRNERTYAVVNLALGACSILARDLVLVRREGTQKQCAAM